jgi:hypothetical protein
MVDDLLLQASAASYTAFKRDSADEASMSVLGV